MIPSKDLQEVWLFGDSYADRNYYNDNSYISWPKLLEEKYSVKNFAKAGTSPSYQLNYLIDNYIIQKNKSTENIIIIFLLSNTLRFDFKFLEPVFQGLPYHYFVQRQEIFKKFNSFEKMLNDSQQRFIVDFFKNFVLHTNYEDSEYIKIISTLYYYSNFFKKTLVWPIFKLPKIENVKNDKFSLVDFKLFDVEPIKYKFGEDPRNNHLSKKHHDVMIESIEQWIDQSIPIDINLFDTKITDNQVKQK